MKEFLITQKGELYLKNKLENLNKKKPELIKELSITRKFGDLSENSEYHSIKNTLNIINKEIKHIENFLSKCKTIKTNEILNKNIINFSAKIKLKNIEEDKYLELKIVGDEEINLEKNSISINSKLANLLIGKSKNDIIKIKQLNKIKKYKIISIEYL